MAKHFQINLEFVTIIGLYCIEAEAHFCRCPKPYPAHARLTIGERIEGVSDPATNGLAAKSREEKLAFWKAQFTRCIKCYGCRNICPQCFCNICTLEDDLWVARGRLPMPMPPMYHLIRAMHMAGKCVGCHECEETCPAGIPVSIHYRLIARDMKEMFGYEAGASLDELPPQLFTLQEGEFEHTGLPD
jgi:ferredoxin